MRAPGRLACCVPFCRRTFKMEPGETTASEILCGKHYRLASPTLRRRLTKLRRALRRTLPHKATRVDRLAALCAQLWDRIKTQSIERAAGL